MLVLKKKEPWLYNVPKRDEQDKKDYELILKAYKYKNRKKGAETNEILAYHLSESLELDISKDDSCIIQKSSS